MVTIFLPFTEIFTIMLMPIPIILLMLHGERVLFYVTVMVLFFLSFIIYPAVSIPITFLALISGIMIGFSIQKKQHPYETWLKGTAGYLFGLVGAYAFIEIVLQYSIADSYKEMMNESLNRTRELFETVGMIQLSIEDFELIREQMLGVLQLIPFILVVISMVLALITQWLTYKWLNRTAEKKYVFPAFRNFQLPKLILWIYFITLMLSLMGGNNDATLFYDIIMNVSNLAGTLLILQGLSFIFYYSYVKVKSTALPIVSILVLVFFPFIGFYFVRILGIIDLGFDLKKRITK